MTDRAGFLSAPAVAQLDRKLGDYARGTGHQVLVYVDHTTGGLPIEDWAVKAFERWRVGRKGIDDGLVLFVFSDDRRVRIEVGYGLEPIMPDTRASRIIREAIVPRVQAGDRDGAVTAGVDAILSALGGAGQPGQSGDPVADSPEHKISPKRFGIGLVGLLVVLFVLLRLALTHPGLAWLLTTMIGSGRGGGRWGGGGGWRGGGGFGGGGGGGFSGGGGRSGGGGASGSW